MMALSGLYWRYPGNRMFKVIPQAPPVLYGMFMERFNELSELRNAHECFLKWKGFFVRCVPRDLKVNETAMLNARA